jgi:hypothetical protein
VPLVARRREPHLFNLDTMSIFSEYSHASDDAYEGEQ